MRNVVEINRREAPVDATNVANPPRVLVSAAKKSAITDNLTRHRRRSTLAEEDLNGKASHKHAENSVGLPEKGDSRQKKHFLARNQKWNRVVSLYAYTL